MLYVARVLHLPNGELLRNRVVTVEDGIVNDIYCFDGELHSMLLVDDVFLSDVNSLKHIEEFKKNSHLKKGERIYAYKLEDEDGLVLLED